MKMRTVMAGLLAASALAGTARADIVLSSNDAHTVLDNGAQVAAAAVHPDTLSVIDLKDNPPRVVAMLEVPGSVVGPPMAVAIARDESFAIVTSATKADPGGRAGIGPNDQVSVIDLTAKPPQLVQALHAGAGATTVRISPDGTLALVANRIAGTLSVFTIANRRLTAAGTVMIDPKSMPSGIAFTADGKSALVTRYGDNMVQVLAIDGAKVTLEHRPITTGVAPYVIDVNTAGTLAAVSNMGRGDGDTDTVSLIDLTVQPFRTVQTISVGESPEGLKWSPDGKYLAVATQEGTAKPDESPFRRDHGRLMIFAVIKQQLRHVAEAPIGRWSQGIAFSRDGQTVLVQDMEEHAIQVFRWDDTKLWPGTSIELGAGPAAIATAWP